jgi:Ca2+-dependent lipid-binding protein
VKECPVPFLERINPFAKYPKIVTSLNVKSGINLVNPFSDSGAISSYIVIKCEGNRVVGKAVNNNLNPDWNTTAIFYRYHVNKPIKIEVSI